MSALGDLALNTLAAVIVGIIDIVAIIVVVGAPVWLLTHVVLRGARRTLAGQERDDPRSGS